jgi:hypothetical protein
MSDPSKVPSKTESSSYSEAKKHVIKPPSGTQADKFKEAARELETDDDEARFDEKLGRIARAPYVNKNGDADRKK